MRCKMDGVICKHNGCKGDRSYRLRRIKDIKLNNKKVKYKDEHVLGNSYSK